MVDDPNSTQETKALCAQLAADAAEKAARIQRAAETDRIPLRLDHPQVQRIAEEARGVVQQAQDFAAFRVAVATRREPKLAEAGA